MNSGTLTTKKVDLALLTWIRIVQGVVYKTEIQVLLKNKLLNNKSSLYIRYVNMKPEFTNRWP